MFSVFTSTALCNRHRDLEWPLYDAGRAASCGVGGDQRPSIYTGMLLVCVGMHDLAPTVTCHRKTGARRCGASHGVATRASLNSGCNYRGSMFWLKYV